MGLGQQGMQRGSDGRRLNVKQRALNDAFSNIFPERASFELRDDDVEALRKQLQKDDSIDIALQELQQRQRDAAETAAWKEKHPCLLQNFGHFFSRAANKRVAVFLDYDGTLAPIVKDPDCAFMSSAMRETVRAVACLFPTAIISGRGREKVEGFVQLKELFYAGSHGMDIIGPQMEDGKEPISFQAAERFAPIMDKVFEDLKHRVRHIQGSSVEHNKFCVSVHFRNCEASAFDEVLEVVQTVLTAHKDLRATRGRKVLEIRPEVEWNKGHALSHLLQSLSLNDSPDVLPIYIGDDRTDEDAFAVLKQNSKGVGILVSTKVKETDATYRVRDPAEVRVFLERLCQWGKDSESAWHKDAACTGWALNKTRLAEMEHDCSNGKTTDGVAGADPSAGFASCHSSRPPIHPRTSIQLERNQEWQNRLQALASQDHVHSNGSGHAILASVDVTDVEKLPPSPFEAQSKSSSLQQP